jgi:uracil-DNA glycosylase family 4
MDARKSSFIDRLKRCPISTCGLHPTNGYARQPVVGVGNYDPKIAFFGEAPGVEEDLAGEPFVGESGKLLNEMIGVMGLPRNDIYISNIAKCHPPNNRDPAFREIKECEYWLWEEIYLVRPVFIVAIGRIAKEFFLPSIPNITDSHGNIYKTWHTIPTDIIEKYGDTNDCIETIELSIMPIVHPSFIKRTGGRNGKWYEATISDLEQLIELCYTEEYGWRKNDDKE